MNRHLEMERASQAAELDWAAIQPLLEQALAEDARWERGPSGPRWLDLTSDFAVERSDRSDGRLVAKQAGRLAGLDVFERTLACCDPDLEWRATTRDGAGIEPGETLAHVRARSGALLVGERTALNFIQRLSGIATRTAQYVERCGGRARILDTRKTTPNLRVLEKYAVRCGGGENHRIGLYDEAMIKNNHADLAGRPYAELLAGLRARVGADVRITAEARDRAEAIVAAQGGADVVMLDNFTPESIEAVLPEVRAAAGDRPLEIEASGGITLDNVARFAATGVDRISIGALTHSAPALDLSLYLAPAGPGPFAATEAAP